METIIKGKEQYGGGWLCYLKKGGCGEKYETEDKRITDQVIGKVENPDIADIYNTVKKMAKKRAFVDAMLTATAASDCFTQDIEEMVKEGLIDTNSKKTKEYKKDPPQKKEEKKSESKSENKNYRKLIFEGLTKMFEGNQTMADKKLVQLSTYQFTDKKTGEVIKKKGTWDIEKLTEGEAQVIWHKLEKELEILNEGIILEGEE